MKFADFHHKGFVGVIDGNNIGGDKYQIHMASWWNGEGLDIELATKEDRQRFRMTDVEITALAALAIAGGYIDPTELGVMSAMIESDHKERNKKRID